MNEFMSRRRLILPSESIPLPYNYWEEGGSNQAILKYNSTPERLYFSGGSYGLFDAFPSDFNGLCNGSYYVNMPYKETPDGLVLADGLGNWQEIEIQIPHIKMFLGLSAYIMICIFKYHKKIRATEEYIIMSI